ncbi:hypothetical protein [Myroides sp. DW712]|uniref:restriction system modified-DNA reader domain-containing protein n=1 Tax=Myroides sp. DW712 TaxID=3389800 RepID=UPI00397D5567
MTYDEKPDITLKMIINAGIIKIGTKVYSSPNNEIIGTIDKEGAITLNLNNEMKTFAFPSGAGRAITKTSINGWKYWRILDEGIYKELSYYKKKYKQTENQY